MTPLRSGVRRCWCRFAILVIFTAAEFAILAISQSGRAMVGGAPTAATDFGRSVVMILGSSGTACTATAIGRDLLLTAAHCVQPGSDYKLVGSEPGQPPILKAVARIARHPQFDMQRLLGHLATADVALIKLAEPLPAQIPLARIGGETETINVGETLVVAGYGVTVRGDGRTGGTVRAASTDRHRATGIAADQAVRSGQQRTDCRVRCLRWRFGGSGFCRLWYRSQNYWRGELVDGSEFNGWLRRSDRDHAAGAVSRLDR